MVHWRCNAASPLALSPLLLLSRCVVRICVRVCVCHCAPSTPLCGPQKETYEAAFDVLLAGRDYALPVPRAQEVLPLLCRWGPGTLCWCEHVCGAQAWRLLYQADKRALSHAEQFSLYLAAEGIS